MEENTVVTPEEKEAEQILEVIKESVPEEKQGELAEKVQQVSETPNPVIPFEITELWRRQGLFYKQIAGKSRVEKSITAIGSDLSGNGGGKNHVGITRKVKAKSKSSLRQSKKSRKINRRRK